VVLRQGENEKGKKLKRKKKKALKANRAILFP
jgi:hypothetical protein